MFKWHVLRKTLIFGLVFWSTGNVLAEETVRILSWNIRNYLVQNRWERGRFRMDYPKPEKEKMAVYEQLLGAGADIVLLQEMGGAGFLNELKRDLAVLGLEYNFAYFARGMDRGRCLALLSRKAPLWQIPAVELPCGEDADGRLVQLRRGLHESAWAKGESLWLLYNLHLKSRYTEDANDPEGIRQRSGELCAIVSKVENRVADTGASWALLCGDFNETPGDAARRHLLQRPGWQLLELQDSDGENWTYHYLKEDRYEAIDAIYIYLPDNQPMPEWVGGIWHRPDLQHASDHRALWIDILPDIVTVSHEYENR